MPTLSLEALQSIRTAVDEALDRAAEVTLPRFRQPIEIDNKELGGFDPVTIADREAEQCLRDVLNAALPLAGFLGEEDSVAPAQLDPASAIELSESVQSKLTWVVDPIDGTRAFITAVPLWGTLVALNDGADVLFGALDQPWIGERFIGYGDHAERVAGGQVTPLKTRSYRALNECILQTTSPDLFTDPSGVAAFSNVRDSVSMTRYGGDCYCYALLVLGGVDAVIESSLQPYDIQALIPIVQGAGGIITDWEGGSAMNGGQVVAASNPELHEQLLEKLRA